MALWLFLSLCLVIEIIKLIFPKLKSFLAVSWSFTTVFVAPLDIVHRFCVAVVVDECHCNDLLWMLIACDIFFVVNANYWILLALLPKAYLALYLEYFMNLYCFGNNNWWCLFITNAKVVIDKIIVDFGAIGIDDIVTDFMVFSLSCGVGGGSTFRLTYM